MAYPTRELHDTCIAIFRQIRASDPELAARALARGVPITIQSPEGQMRADLKALDAVASSFATGDRASKRDFQRVEQIIQRATAATLSPPDPRSLVR